MTEDLPGQRGRVVGFAIQPEKVKPTITQSSRTQTDIMNTTDASMQAKKHLTPELLKQAAAAHIQIRAIDPSEPVAQQGPFDIVLQKCRDHGKGMFNVDSNILLRQCSSCCPACELVTSRNIACGSAW